jgi:hypothetical protein
MWRSGHRTATQREARQPIGSGSSASERAKIIRAMTSPLMKITGIGLKCMDRGLSWGFSNACWPNRAAGYNKEECQRDCSRSSGGSTGSRGLAVCDGTSERTYAENMV